MPETNIYIQPQSSILNTQPSIVSPLPLKYPLAYNYALPEEGVIQQYPLEDIKRPEVYKEALPYSSYFIDPVFKRCASSGRCATEVTYNLMDALMPLKGAMNFAELRKHQDSESSGFSGSAWEWLDKNDKAQVIFNVFADPRFDGVTDQQQVRAITKQLVKNHDFSDIKPGDVVTISMRNSSNFPKALAYSKKVKDKTRRTLSTHIGTVIQRNGKLYVHDMITGAKEWPLEQLISGNNKWGMLISGIIRANTSHVPKQELQKPRTENGVDMRPLGLDRTYSDPLISYDGLHSEGMYGAMNALLNNKDRLMYEYGLSEEQFKKYMGITSGLITQESLGGRPNANRTYQKSISNISSRRWKSLAGALSSIVSRFIPQDWYQEESIGLGNVKPHQHFTKEQIDQFEFDQFIPKVFWSKDQFKKSEDPAFSGIITFKTFISNLNKAKDLYPELNNERLYEHLAALAHNQGFDNLTVEYNRSKKLKQSPEEKKFFSMSDRDTHNRLINDLASKFSEEELGLLKSYLFNQGYSKFITNILSSQNRSVSAERISQIKKAIAEFGKFYPLALLSGMYTPYSYADKTVRYFPAQSTFRLGGKLNYLNLFK